MKWKFEIIRPVIEKIGYLTLSILKIKWGCGIVLGGRE